ncbi:MAG: hypothetical protein E5Y55_24270 [Mesorhizobium sp.]|uniref:hypothetical protein n=1 Tax=Mesorhizobium sp. TaxID=1871066 RepID=UPI0011FEF127|nr:hypothetical protein [Mesorhizobium sp.]TIM41797.1 MAG: hypothetical protein E5Y55_24270 [Mesorhizobium sp.]
MTAEKKIPTYRKGDIVLCQGRVTESVHDDSVYVKFGESGECPQLCAADITKVVRHAIVVGNRVSWSEDAGAERCRGEVLAVNPDPANDKIWLWIKEDGCWLRVTRDLAEVTRL